MPATANSPTPSYSALIAKVRDWANRDSETLPDSIIKDAVRYGADNVYRELRVPPLEAVATYTIDATTSGTDSLNIPEDLSEFISLRRLDAATDFVSSTAGQNAEQTIVYNHKADYRTFRDITADQYSYYRWTRRENQILVNPTLNEGETYELYYYRRLPAMNATYAVIPANFDNRLLVDLGATAPSATAPITLTFGSRTVNYTEGTQLFFLIPDTTMDADFTPTPGTDTALAAAPATIPNDMQLVSRYFFGEEPPNWLRDEQEKLIIWASLVHVFDYLGESEMMQKYLAKATADIQQLNEEEGRRRVSGGNTQQNFDGFLI